MEALYGDSLGEALRFAAWLHRDQSRKRAVVEPRLSKPVPYITHLLDVASLALAAGADDDQTVAALLHDAFEDQPTTPAGDDTRSEIGTRFGPRVVELIDACTDQTGDPDAPRDSSTWAERKTHHIAALSARGGNDPAVLLVPLADKAANCRAIVEDVRADGRLVWRRFNADPADLVWYYESMTAVVTRVLGHSALSARLAADVVSMRELAVAEEVRRLTIDALDERFAEDTGGDLGVVGGLCADQAGAAVVDWLRQIAEEDSPSLAEALGATADQLGARDYSSEYFDAQSQMDDDGLSAVGWVRITEIEASLETLLPGYDVDNRCLRAARGLRALVQGDGHLVLGQFLDELDALIADQERDADD